VVPRWGGKANTKARYDVGLMPTDYTQELAALKNALEAARAYL
jgi:hypothetical protein